MKKYLLHTDGSIKNREDVLDNLDREDVKDIKDTLSNSIYKNKRDISNLDSSSYLKSEYKEVADLFREDFTDDSPINMLPRRAELEKISSFDFVSEDNSEKIFSFLPFNSSNEVFAEEFEMLTGWTESNSKTFTDFRILPLFSFFNDAFRYIARLELFTEVNRLFLGNNNVVENYSFRYGSYTIKGIDVYSKFIFEKLNYPKEKMSIDERIASFVIGFLVWIKPDRLIDIDQLIKEVSSEFGAEIDNFLELTSLSTDSKTNWAYNNPLSTLIMPVLFYIIEGLLTINGSLEKRVKLLFNKFSMEKVWDKNLFNAKNKENEIFREFDYYYVKFYIERIHVGSKIFRNVLQRASYLPLYTKESPSSRVAGGKFYQTTNLEISNKEDGNYLWKSSLSKQQDYKFEQTTRIRALPQGLLLNDRIISNIFACKDPDESDGSVPLVNIGEDLLQNFYKPVNKEGKRLPASLVKSIEEHLESEYMPFYFHDLRTNEIISFHAFLSSYSDRFNPNYSTQTGFGRVEGAKIYKYTSRSVSLTFTLAATSKKDHDLMWYQINKLVSMCYPQFSKGVRAKQIDENSNLVDAGFSYPFTQVPTASPLIRLRVGDILKSNYSPRNITRLHEIDFKDDDIKDANADNKSSALPTGIIPAKFMDSEETDRNYTLLPGLYRDNLNLLNIFDPTLDLKQGYANIKRPVKVKKPKGNISIGINENVNVEVDDPESNFHGVKLTVDSRSVVEYKPHQKSKGTAKPNSGNQTINQNLAGSIVSSTLMTNNGATQQLNNPITKAFESGMGRGMAGVIENLGISGFDNSPWETSEIGSRAPLYVKINVTFAPIHDITPGLDHTGMMRAPAYNVGKINNEMFGDVYDKLELKQENQTKMTSGIETTKSNVLKINKTK
jgi:hypothetical protein